jgi:hypothetical protein
MSDEIRGDGGYSFVMSFVSASDKFRQQYVEKWQEVVANFMVEGSQTFPTQGQRTPYSRNRVYKSARNAIFLKDAETHKLVMTFVSKLSRAILGDREGKFVQAQPVGYEDVAKSQAVTRLLRYAFGLPGHFRTLVEAFLDMILFGTSVVEVYWRYEEREVVVRSVMTDGMTEVSSTTRQTLPVYDDVCIRRRSTAWRIWAAAPSGSACRRPRRSASLKTATTVRLSSRMQSTPRRLGPPRKRRASVLATISQRRPTRSLPSET